MDPDEVPSVTRPGSLNAILFEGERETTECLFLKRKEERMRVRPRNREKDSQSLNTSKMISHENLPLFRNVL